MDLRQRPHELDVVDLRGREPASIRGSALEVGLAGVEPPEPPPQMSAPQMSAPEPEGGVVPTG